MQLNDEEYNIPALAETPTLESILNEDESSLLSEDDLAQLLPEEVIKLSPSRLIYYDALSLSSDCVFRFVIISKKARTICRSVVLDYIEEIFFLLLRQLPIIMIQVIFCGTPP